MYLKHWDAPEGRYTVTVDNHAPCPAGTWGSRRNCARRDPEGDWYGDTSVLGETHHTFTEQYAGSGFTAAALTIEEAEAVALAFAHWAEGDVFAVELEPMDGHDRQRVEEVYGAGGRPPGLDEIKEILERGSAS